MVQHFNNEFNLMHIGVGGHFNCMRANDLKKIGFQIM